MPSTMRQEVSLRLPQFSLLYLPRARRRPFRVPDVFYRIKSHQEVHHLCASVGCQNAHGCDPEMTTNTSGRKNDRRKRSAYQGNRGQGGAPEHEHQGRTLSASAQSNQAPVKVPNCQSVHEAARRPAKAAGLHHFSKHVRNTGYSPSRRHSRRTGGADLYVVRVTTSTGRLGNARPCGRCVAWCEWAGVRRIYYWDEKLNDFEVIRVGREEQVVHVTQSERTGAWRGGRSEVSR